MVGLPAFVAVMFFNIVAGTFSRRQTMGVYISLMMVFAISGTQPYLSQLATDSSVSLDIVVVLQGTLSSLFLWSPIWLGSLANSFK